MKFLFLMAWMLFLLAPTAYTETTKPLIKMLMLPRCHMCHDPFIPRDHLVLVPETDLIRMERDGEFRIFIENTFSSPLRGVELLVENPAFDIRVRPRVLEKLLPGERTFFLIELNLREGYELGDYPLRVSARAKEAILRPSIEKVGVVVNEVPQLPPPPPSEVIVPDIVPEVKPPEPVIPPKEEVPIQRNVVAPPVEERVEPPSEEVGEIVVRVEEFILAKHWYLYLIPILLLIGLLVWRRLRQK